MLISGKRRVPAHRLVLSAASDQLAAMMLSCDVGSVAMTTEISVPEMDESALDDVINYIYTGKLAPELLKVMR